MSGSGTKTATTEPTEWYQREQDPERTRHGRSYEVRQVCQAKPLTLRTWLIPCMIIGTLIPRFQGF